MLSLLHKGTRRASIPRLRDDDLIHIITSKKYQSLIFLFKYHSAKPDGPNISSDLRPVWHPVMPTLNRSRDQSDIYDAGFTIKLKVLINARPTTIFDPSYDYTKEKPPEE